MVTTWIFNFTTGNDTTGNGTLATPYKTAFKAGSVMQPGDSIANSDGQSTEADDVTITDAAALTSINCSLPNNSFNINQSDPSISTTATGLILSGNDSNTNLLLADCQGSLTIAGATLTSNYPGSGATDVSFQFLPAGYLRLTGIRGTAPSCMRFNGTVYGAYIDDFIFTGTTQAMDGNVGGLDTPVDVVVGDLVGGTVTATGTATNALWTNDGDYINTFSMNKVTFHCINTDPDPANLGDCFIFDSISTCTITLSNCDMLADTVANGIRLGVNVGVGVNKTLRLSNVSMDLHTGTLTTGSAFVVNRDTVTATGAVTVNANKLLTLTNGGTFDATGLTVSGTLTNITTGVFPVGTLRLPGVMSGGTLTSGSLINAGSITSGVIGASIVGGKIEGGTLTKAMSGGTITGGIVNASLTSVLWTGGTCTSLGQINGSTMTGGRVTGTLTCANSGTLLSTNAIVVTGVIVVNGVLTITKGAGAFTDTGAVYKLGPAGQIIPTAGVVITGQILTNQVLSSFERNRNRLQGLIQ